MDYEATLALQIDRLMRRFHSDLHPRAQRIDEEKVGPIGGMILFVISESSPISAQEIAQTLGRDKSQVSRVISLLVGKGLVEKSNAATDARSSDLRLTDKGLLQVAAFNGALVESAKTTLAALDQNELRQFSSLLSKILGT
ncbi:MAG: MarR family winged helix-turn-helix transcriptional regulator [Pseudomonadota bacterium]